MTFRTRGPGAAALLIFTALLGACSYGTAGQKYFGRVVPPRRDVLRYISGPEPESLDPQLITGQPETRIVMALFEGLVEYDPQTMAPVPALAERWEANADASEYVFSLRRGARWSDGSPLTAHDFVYSFRRGVSPGLASRNAYLAYPIKYAEAYNEGAVFVRAPEGRYVTSGEAEGHESSSQPTPPGQETPFRRSIAGPLRLVLPGDAAKRAELLGRDARLRALVEGKEFVPVRAEDVGVEAVDDHTLRVTLGHPAAFFVSLLPHPFFRAVPRRAIDRHGAAWAAPGRIVTSGPFKLHEWEPYDRLAVTRDPMYWDAANVRLAGIVFYPVEDLATAMHLYKAGEVDATHNGSVPAGWLDAVRTLGDYMNAPENSVEFYRINTLRPPMDDVRVRRAFAAAIDRRALAALRRTLEPSASFTPADVFPGYPRPAGVEFNPELARRLLAEAGYRDEGGAYDPGMFPSGEVELSYNTSESHRAVAEFVQSQWRRHLGVTVRLRGMEFKTFIEHRARMEYKGFARSGWVGDYQDPYSFLDLFSTPAGNNGTGWWDPRYREMLDAANANSDSPGRHDLLARAEEYLLGAQPVIPLGTETANWLKKPYVKGVYANPGTLHAWKYAYIERDASKWD